ncbi:hypothetical protein EHP00_439 [Ecytonucleospora hepatopenaei]|uniref:Uncharacterized protein n=1 Tax=Ecytonucleospora hepatopenaei TaxID=646526 RepID=A0A1W0E901_9MICR|nr:hypothetical protein EHP00_439 [Ecytonucleospora hepatopenaei]
MIHGMENAASTKCALDSKKHEAFTQKSFSELIYAAHAQGQDYYIARIQCSADETMPSYYCYDARHLCKYIFEMVISSEGRKIRIKNFVDPIHGKDIMDIHFFKMRYESETPLKAEYAGSHVTFLESSVFRSKIFFNEDPLEALSVNFQFKNNKKQGVVTKKKFLMFLGLTFFLLCIGAITYMAMVYVKKEMGKKQENIKETASKNIKEKAERSIQQDKPQKTKTVKKSVQKSPTQVLHVNPGKAMV